MKTAALTEKDFAEPTIVVSVGKYKKPGRSLEDISRGYWRVGNSRRAQACKWLVAVNAGIVEGIWQIDKTKGNGGWMLPRAIPKVTWPEDKGDDVPNRRGCELLPMSPEISKKFLKKNIASIRRLYFPFAYIGV